MGTLVGHVLPGTLFLIYAIWQTFSVTYRFHKSKHTRNKFSTTAAYNDFSWCCKVPVEAIFKMVSASIGIAVESYAATPDLFHDPQNSQHTTMYAFFFLAGLIDLLISLGTPVPPDVDYLAMALAFSTEALLFASHTHGRTPLDIEVHQFLNYTLLACVASIILEISSTRRRLIVALTRIFFIMWHGAWFVAVGLIMYPPKIEEKWDEEAHKNLMIATDMFAFTAGLVLVTMLGIYWGMMAVTKCRAPSWILANVKRRSETERLAVISRQRDALPAVEDDSDSEDIL
ncbi:unnamed protein product [Notodromas monacha]|uniref:Transmembrane protein 45B n=1 Tax=Notodromas monacha TaxID=399045 RepID=A0A7R9BJ03_9CRUS|nr:unnamed protein product [Notodromas monacha]CAG0915288.1 unnamed protein product [Notodromas monacha]